MMIMIMKNNKNRTHRNKPQRDVRTYVQTEFLPILQDFVPYWGRCPKRKERKKERKKKGKKEKGKKEKRKERKKGKEKKEKKKKEKKKKKKKKFQRGWNQVI